jgi:hypothetical protein
MGMGEVPGWRVEVEPRIMLVAYLNLRDISAFNSLSKPPVKLPRAYVPFLEKDWELKMEFDNVIETYKARKQGLVNEWVAYCEAERILWCLYLLNVPAFPASAVIPVFSLPPQLAVQGYIHPSSWIQVALIPVRFKNGRIHKPLQAKVFYTEAFKAYGIYNYRRLRELMEKVPVLFHLYSRNASKYGEGTHKAYRNTLRDWLRLLLSHVLLITATYMARRVRLYPDMAKHILANPVHPLEILPKTVDEELREALGVVDWRKVIEV